MKKHEEVKMLISEIRKKKKKFSFTSLLLDGSFF